MAQTNPAVGRVVVAGAVTLQSVEAVHAQLLALAEKPVIEIDCSAVTEVDVSLVQLILAARGSARRMGRDVRLLHPAAGALRDTLERGGFLSAGSDRPADNQEFWLQAGS